MPSKRPPGKGKGGRAGGRDDKKPFGARAAKPSSGPRAGSKSDSKNRFGDGEAFTSRKSTPSAFKPAADENKGPRSPRTPSAPRAGAAPRKAAATDKPESKRAGKRPPKAVRQGGDSFGREPRTPFVKSDRPGTANPRKGDSGFSDSFERPKTGAKPRGTGRPQTKAYPPKDSPDALYNRKGEDADKPTHSGKPRESFNKLERPTRSKATPAEREEKPSKFRPAKSEREDNSVFREVKQGKPSLPEHAWDGGDGESFERPAKPVRVPGAFGKREGAEKEKREDKRKLPETKRFGYGKVAPVKKGPATVDGFGKKAKPTTNKPDKKKFKNPSAGPTPATDDGATRLNKYLAHAGISSRRHADEIIAAGEVTVNGEIVHEMGYRVAEKDVVKYKGKVIKPTRNMVYILLNKPKDYLTTTSDDMDRHTVMELVSKATDQRVYPVGRLDRNTTGLLIMTNDGDLAQKLSHPSHKMKKVYHAVLDKPISEEELLKIADGLMLEDGKAEIDAIAYADHHDKTQVGIELHIGKNRIVRRIFEHLGFDVVKLDRVFYGGLTKKDLPRGRWRYLEEKEVIMLKHFSGGK